MKSEALRSARSLLKSHHIKAYQLSAALEAILIQADRVKSWTPVVEAAHSRLSKREKQNVQSQMLGFYYTIGDWESALRFMPARPNTPVDLLFSMDTLLNLKSMKAASR